MSEIDDLQVFVRTADLGSFSAAARELGISPAVASLAIQRLEQKSQVRLFVRSTRALRLTTEGELFLSHVRESLHHLQLGYQSLRLDEHGFQGPLQLAAPSDLGRHALLSWLQVFKQRFPTLEIRLLICDQWADLYRQPVDLAIRYGVFDDSSLIALPIAPHNRRIFCASPDYLARHGTPHQPQELTQHACLAFMRDHQLYDQWRYEDAGQTQVVTIQPRHTCNDAEIVRRWAVAGEGVAYKSWLDVAEDVRAGRLVWLMPAYSGESVPLSLVCPHRNQLTPVVKALLDLLRQQCDTLAFDYQQRLSALTSPDH